MSLLTMFKKKSAPKKDYTVYELISGMEASVGAKRAELEMRSEKVEALIAKRKAEVKKLEEELSITKQILSSSTPL